jgi:membrane associated rhomboid family serine protease
VWYDPFVPRAPSYRSIAYSFGPGRVGPAIKWLIWANVIAFLIREVFSDYVITYLALAPELVLTRGWIWQIVTYMFLHADVVHLLLNMLTLWMFGTELERLWGTRAFLKYYFLCGIGAGICTILVALLPFDFAANVYLRPTVGASGAIYGLLLAYGVIFKDRPIYMWFLFPVPAKWFVIITGALVLWSSITDPTGGTAHMAHLGGMIFGYVYLKTGQRGGPWLELKYRYTKWRMNRLRKRFDVHHGGRSAPPPGGWTH